jgi:hypothetical protein
LTRPFEVRSKMEKLAMREGGGAKFRRNDKTEWLESFPHAFPMRSARSWDTPYIDQYVIKAASKMR